MRKQIVIAALVALLLIGGGVFFIVTSHHSKSTGPGADGTPTHVAPVTGSDTEAPVLTADNLTDGATLTCNLTLTPTVSDDRAVSRVEYSVDGTQLFVSYAAPFSVDQSLQAYADGATHVIEIRAYDAADNKATLSRSVTIQSGTGCGAQPVASAPVTTQRAATSTKKASGATTGSTDNAGGNGDNGGTPVPADTQNPTDPSSLAVTFNANGHYVSLTWTASTDNVAVDHYVISRGGVQLSTSKTARFFDMRISDGQLYSYTVTAVDAAGNVSGASNQTSIRLAPQGIWQGVTPPSVDNSPDPVEIGQKFVSRVAGQAVGVQFYKDSTNTGTHVGTLWDNSGNQLATVTFSAETASGWQVGYFSNPVTMTPQTIYVVSAYMPNGHESYDSNYSSSGHGTATLSTGALNAVFRTSAGYPSTPGFGNAGYAVDIAFAPTTPTAQGPITGTIASKYNQWSHGPSASNSVFPTGIWQQWAGRQENGIDNGINYQNIGIQTDINVPHTDTLQTQSVADDNWKMFSTVTSHDDRSVLDGVTWANTNPAGAYSTGYWMDDEPDMNQVNYPTGNVYEPLAEETFGNQVRAADPTRPTYANFGKGLAIDSWGGYSRVQTGSIDSDAQHYCNAADIASADYYGWTDPNEAANYHGAWTYGKVLDNMRKHCGDNKIIYGFVETGAPFTSQGNAPKTAPTPADLEAAIWNMVVHGANGMIYFAQQFFGSFVEDSVLLDPVMKAKVQAVNAQLQTYAPILNTVTTKYLAAGESNTAGVPVDVMAKVYNGDTYVFAQSSGSLTQNNSASVTGTVSINTLATTATVVGESRTVPIVNGKIVDSFSAYQMHVYKF